MSAIARLTPSNHDAKRAFNDLAVVIKGNNSKVQDFVHAARFLIITPYVQHSDKPDNVDKDGEDPETDVPEADTDIEAGGTEVETESESKLPARPPNQLRFEGHYELSFGTRPSFPRLGWFIGVGRWDAKSTKPNGGVDLQLALPKTNYEVAGRHARLFFDKTGSLILQVVSDRSPVVRLGDDEFTQGQRLVTQSKTRITFGKLSYTLEFGTSDQEEYQRGLKKFFSNQLGFDAPPPDLSATPSPWDIKLGSWLVRGTVGRGAFGTVSAAKHTISGTAGAAKFFVRTQNTHQAIAQEVKLLRALPPHPRILRFCDVQYERQNAWFTGPADEEDERYHFKARPERVVIVYTPFARTTFAETFPPEPVQLIALYQILQGIGALHSAGFIHRDIKPGNLGIVSLSPENINTVILDYGCTVRATTCEPKPGSVGTIPFLSPEMEATTYGPGVDIWACGVFGYCMFVSRGQLKWRYVVKEKDKYDIAVAGLQEHPPDSVEALLSQMLAWDPAERISAEVALQHSCFSRLQPNRLLSPSKPAQKRKRR